MGSGDQYQPGIIDMGMIKVHQSLPSLCKLIEFTKMCNLPIFGVDHTKVLINKDKLNLSYKCHFLIKEIPIMHMVLHKINK